MSTPTRTQHQRQQVSAAQERARRTERDTIYHPAFDRPTARALPAGAALFIMVIALVFALIFNSAGVLHLALGMRPGIARTVALGVVRPVNDFAHTLWLDRPKQQLDRVFGQEFDTTGGTELAGGGDGVLKPGQKAGPSIAVPAPSPSPTEPKIVAPTVADPLRVEVMGDSLSTYVAQQLDASSQARKLVQIKTLWRDGTGLNVPEFFNWQAAVQNEVRKNRPQVVIMVLGGNDVQNMTRDGALLAPDTDEWQTEYVRRIAVVMSTLIAGGVQRVYWAPPPIARTAKWDLSFKRINAAAQLAVKSVPGSRYVDTYNGSAVNGGYSDFAVIDGQSVRARQSDGIHWTFKGARTPTEQILTALAADYGNVI